VKVGREGGKGRREGSVGKESGKEDGKRSQDEKVGREGKKRRWEGKMGKRADGKNVVMAGGRWDGGKIRSEWESLKETKT
jgi:hypothetical protein